MSEITLNEWQRLVLPRLRTESFADSPIRNVTLLAYFFWDDERIETLFFTVECAFLCAWHCWGMMPSELVVNRTTPTIEAFAERYGVHVQIDSSLTGGVPTMNVDCIRNLHRRFDTEYVVIIQSDGLPVNPGLERFLGKWDYIGAPWWGEKAIRNAWTWPKFNVGNGGFCIRTKRICEAVAKAYNKFWKYLPYIQLKGDDRFYCKAMPFLSRRWRKSFRYANVEEALEFSVERLGPVWKLKGPPVGFHSEDGFRIYTEYFGLPLRELIPPELQPSIAGLTPS